MQGSGESCSSTALTAFSSHLSKEKENRANSSKCFLFIDKPPQQHSSPSKNSIEFQDWASQLDNIQHSGLSQNWTCEFNTIYPPTMTLDPVNHVSHNWTMEFNTQQDDQFKEFETVFQYHLENTNESHWVEAFAQAEAQASGQTTSLSTWTQEFEKAMGRSEDKDEALFEEFNKIWNQETFSNHDFTNLQWQEHSDALFSGSTEYLFEKENPFLSEEHPLERALQMLRDGELLSKVALALEAAVQKDGESSEAWMHLGIVQAENEKEIPAIAALRRSVEADSRNLKALMALAVSYTNEGRMDEAVQTLGQWLQVQYPTLFDSSEQVYNREIIIQKFMEAVRVGCGFAVDREVLLEGMDGVPHLDADVQVGLGVLFYTSSEYEKSIDCFKTALTVRPMDYKCWNRLGATYANSGQSEQAVDAYYRALELCPTFVRGRYNLGVTCLNMGCHKEAAEHLLNALSMHQLGPHQDQQNISQNLWDTLRRVFLLMDRKDLAERAFIKGNVDEFRSEFEF